MITAAAFVRAWAKAKTVQDVCSELGLSYIHVASRANHLRKRGVNLPKLPPRPDRAVGNKLDVAALNALLLKPTGGEP